MKSRGWCFTVNNYDDNDIASIKALEHEGQYVVCGQEVGKEGTPHLQGYVYFKTQRHFTAVKKLIGARAHVECARADAAKNRTYCTKENTLFEFGEMPTQGKRNDIHTVREAIKEGQCLRDIAEIATSFQSVKGAQSLLTLLEPPRSWKPEVRWYFGQSGAGKTRAAYDWLGPELYQPTTLKWWDGYDGHEAVLIDDFRPRHCDFVFLLRLLDRYGMRVECKGGSRQFRPKRIAITSIQDPRNMTWLDDEPIEQLMRRIDDIILVSEDKDAQA